MAAAPRVANGNHRSLRVLIVDDDRDTADSLCVILRLTGHECRAAYEVHDALAAAEEFQPHAVLLDLGMLQNGFHVAEELRKRGATVRIVAVTGHTDQAHRLRSERSGFDLYLVKPVEPESLISLLRELAAAKAADGGNP